MRFTYKTGSRPLDGYTIKRGVGVGGFGEVYFALSDAGKEVALKRIQRNLDIEVRGVSQCINLKHGNLIALYDLKYDDEGQAWVVMEYVAGESLKDVIDRNPNGMPPDDVDRWFRGIADGVAYLHERGIVHRDLKPGNIFEDEGVVKIGDYGLSKFISASRRSGQTESVGTFHYMAPEIGKGVYGKEIDVYALGIILYEMLTGTVPFDGETSQEIIMKHLTDSPDLSNVPSLYRAAIQRALHKDPDSRFSSVRDMLDALSGHSPAKPIAASDSTDTSAMEYRVAREEPIYIGDEEEDPDIVFGRVRHNEIVNAEIRPPVRRPGSPQVPVARLNPTPAAPRRPVARRPLNPSVQRPVSWWNQSGLSVPVKIVVLLTVVLLIAFNPWLIPFALIAGGVLLLVACIRAIASRSSTNASPVNPPGRVAYGDPRWPVAVRKALRKKPASERIAELSGSLLASAAVVAVLCLVFLLLEGESLDGTVVGWSLYAWLTLTSTIGTWLLLLAGKFWEGAEAEHFGRRFVMLLLGLAFGAVAFGGYQALMVEVADQDQWTVHAVSQDMLNGVLYSADGIPQLGAYLVYFGGLFVILRWWTQADPLRKTRLSLMATAACVLWAWVMHIFCPFPQPWGFMMAAAISVAVQMAAPWVNPRLVISMDNGSSPT